MTKSKGRFAQEKRLVRLDGAGDEEPDEAPDWEPPDDVLQEEHPIIFDDENRLLVRLAWDGAQLADFCLALQTRIEGKWLDVVRYDCAHGTVHAHYFRRDGSELHRRTVRQISGFKDVRDGYDIAYKAISKWEDHRRGF